MALDHQAIRSMQRHAAPECAMHVTSQNSAALMRGAGRALRGERRIAAQQWVHAASAPLQPPHAGDHQQQHQQAACHRRIPANGDPVTLRIRLQQENACRPPTDDADITPLHHGLTSSMPAPCSTAAMRSLRELGAGTTARRRGGFNVVPLQRIVRQFTDVACSHSSTPLAAQRAMRG